MSVWKRYKGKKTKRGDKFYDLATWVAEGQCDGQRYKVSLDGIKTAEQARAAEDDIKQKIRNGEFLESRDRTKFSEYIDSEFMPYCRQNLASHKQKQYESNTLKAFFGNIPLKSITPSKCEQFKRWRKSQTIRCQKCENGLAHDCSPAPVSNATVNRELVTLKGVFNRAEADRKIRDNPMRFVPMLEENPPRERYLSSDERVRLVEALKKNYQLWAIVMLGLLTGWRKDQILHLKVSDIDHAERKVWVMKQKRKPRRKVPVGQGAWTILMSLVEVREEWLFINPSGQRLVEFNPAWWKVLSDARIENFRFHDLRHSFATSLMPHVNEFAIQHALGHSRLQTTQGYAHVKDEYLRAGLDALEMGEIPSHPAIITPSDEVM